MTRRTVLYDAHCRSGARMVDFSGWEMPLHYGSQLDEHHAVRRDCGMFDVSHMCAADVSGPDAKAFLLQLIASNVGRLKVPGRSLYGVMLNDAGGVVDDLIVTFLDDTHYRLVVNAGTADKDLAWMSSHLAGWGMDAAILPRRELAMVAVQGPNAREHVWQAMPEARLATSGMAPFHAMQVGDVFFSRTGYTGEDGFEITLPSGRAVALWQTLLDAGVRPCGLGARDTLRLEAGMNLYGQDMDEAVSPMDAGLAWTIDLVAGRDFVGKPALADHGRRNRFMGLLLLDRGVLRAHQKVLSPQGEGLITSGGFSPTLQRSIALARLPMGGEAGDNVQVEIRDKLHTARVVKPPFVRNGKILVNLEATT